MSYKAEFQSNNVDLQSVLDMVNALEPDTGSGETDVKLCIATIFSFMTNTANTTLYYTAADGTLKSLAGVATANQYAQDVPVGSICAVVSTARSADIAVVPSADGTEPNILLDKGYVVVFVIGTDTTIRPN